jgi:hypothetical protein
LLNPEPVKTIAEGTLPVLLRDLHLDRRTGLVEFRSAGHRSRVCFIRGHIVWGDSTDPECRLGTVLVRHRLVTPETLEKASHLVDEQHRLGEVLVESFGFDARWRQAGLGLHVREILLAVFGWKGAAFDFEEHPPEHFTGYDGSLSVPTAEVVLDAVWSVANPDVIRFAIGDLDRVLCLSHGCPDCRLDGLGLTPTDAFVMSRVDGTTTAREMLTLVPAGRDEVLRSLFGLLCTGLAEWSPAAAVNEMARPAPPTPAPPTPAPPTIAPEIVLTRPDTVEEILARASQELASGLPDDALTTLDKLPADPGAARQRARMLRARALLAQPGRVAEAKAELLAVTRDDPAHAEAYFLLGQIYRDGGASAAAAAMFRRVLSFRPRHAGARAELKRIGA